MLRLCHFAYLCPSIERMRKDYSLKVNNEVNSKKQNVRKNLLPSLSDAHPLSCQGSNLDFLESKSSVLPVTLQDKIKRTAKLTKGFVEANVIFKPFSIYFLPSHAFFIFLTAHEKLSEDKQHCRMDCISLRFVRLHLHH